MLWKPRRDTLPYLHLSNSRGCGKQGGTVGYPKRNTARSGNTRSICRQYFTWHNIMV
jgi:hypothetical protein